RLRGVDARVGAAGGAGVAGGRVNRGATDGGGVRGVHGEPSRALRGGALRGRRCRTLPGEDMAGRRDVRVPCGRRAQGFPCLRRSNCRTALLPFAWMRKTVYSMCVTVTATRLYRMRRLVWFSPMVAPCQVGD